MALAFSVASTRRQGFWLPLQDICRPLNEPFVHLLHPGRRPLNEVVGSVLRHQTSTQLHLQWAFSWPCRVFADFLA